MAAPRQFFFQVVSCQVRLVEIFNKLSFNSGHMGDRKRLGKEKRDVYVERDHQILAFVSTRWYTCKKILVFCSASIEIIDLPNVVTENGINP